MFGTNHQEKAIWNLQFHCARKRSRNRRQNDDACNRRVREPAFLRTVSSVYPEKTQCFVQILTFKSHPWYSSSNAICQERLANTIRIFQDSTAEKVRFDQRWRKHSAAICRHWVATRNQIATRYCRTHRLDAAVPMHKASQHMQKTIAQHQQRRQRVTWNHQFHCARRSSQIRLQSEDCRTHRATEPTFLCCWTSVYPEKTECFVQILTCKSHHVTVAMQSAKKDLQNAIELQRTPLEHIALMHQFQCTKYCLDLDLYLYQC